MVLLSRFSPLLSFVTFVLTFEVKFQPIISPFLRPKYALKGESRRNVAVQLSL